MAESGTESKRANRILGLGDALAKTLDPVLRKRGFATRDLIERWSVIAPPPYNLVTAPDRLVWPRGERSADGATLYLRCAASHVLALGHEGAVVAGSVNRYFGYVLVRSVRLSADLFIPGADSRDAVRAEPTAETAAAVETAVAEIRDEGLREALRQLGHGVLARRK